MQDWIIFEKGNVPMANHAFQGLSSEEVTASRQKFGANALTEQASETFFEKFKGNFDDPIIKILCFALAIDVVFVIMGQTEWYEAVGIAVAVLLATFVSTYSEYQNETAFRKLQDEASQILCKVYRDGSLKEIPIDELVVNDYVLVQAGDRVPADGILIDGSIHVDQSVLNGEAKEAEKTPTTVDDIASSTTKDFLHPHKIFRGSVVCDGNAVLLVTTVGDKTVYGGIAKELQSNDERDTPLKLKLTKLAGDISKFGYVGGIAIACAFMFDRIVIQNAFNTVAIAAYCQDWMALGSDLVDAIILAVIIIVMAVPEGLPLMIAIVSAQNMGKMLKDNVLVRKVAGIETAGSLNILFSDKTGTITKGHLEAVSFLDGTSKTYSSFHEIPSALAKMVDISIRNNTSAVITDGVAVGGNATERALYSFIADDQLSPNITIEDTVPFNSKNKFSMAHVKGDFNGTLIKGAPEKILHQCSYYLDAEGKKQPLTHELEINEAIDEQAGRAIRILALAAYDGKAGETLPEKDLIFIGAVGIRDEIRPESVKAIQEVQQAGVQVVMITGDRLNTAIAIAREADLVRTDDDVTITSEHLASMSDDEVRRILPHLRVVARALPSDKSRLVRIAQSMNLVVGMTGDGVNDSPALHQADVGFSMGGGTEVAKEASDIVILDDNFHSIERAILYGRTIFNSIRKFIVFQLTINVGAVMISFVLPLLGEENPLTITQILWVNLVMDTLAALAFGGEPALQRYMAEPPKRRDENIISCDMASAIGVGSAWSFILSIFLLLCPLASCFFRPDYYDKYLMTGYFAFFIFFAVFNAFNARTDKLNLFDNIKLNKGFLRVMGGIAIVQVIMTYFGGAVLRCYGLTVYEWAFVLFLSFSVIPVDLTRKLLFRCKK